MIGRRLSEHYPPVVEGLLSRLGQIPHRPLRHPPLPKMVRQLRGDGRRLRAIALRQALPHAPVHLQPLQRSHPHRQHLAIERMLKPVALTEGTVRPRLQAYVLQEVVLLPQRRTEAFDRGHGDVQPRRPPWRR